MPIYHTEPWLREAVDSILAQTYTDFELIALDDCSPGDAEKILDTYTDSRIVRYRGEQNVGLANILNHGLDIARGKYIARMDSDDLSLPTRLAVQVAYLEAHPDIDLCSTAMQLFGSRSELWVRSQDPEKVKIDALFHSPILHASSLWRRERFEAHRLRFDQQYVPAEDYRLWTQALLCGLRLVNLPAPLYLYRIHPQQATSHTSPREQEVRQAYLQATLPSLSPRQQSRFPLSWVACLMANRRNHYFDPTLLLKRLLKTNLHKWLHKSHAATAHSTAQKSAITAHSTAQ